VHKVQAGVGPLSQLLFQNIKFVGKEGKKEMLDVPRIYCVWKIKLKSKFQMNFSIYSKTVLDG
jgi:hypothetical protein